MPSALSVTVFGSLEEIPATTWDAIVGSRSVTLTSAFWSVLEKSNLNDFDYRYLVVSDAAGRAVAVSVAYAITTDIAIFSSPTLSRLLQMVRKVWPRFLKWKMLECGTPITINTPPFAMVEDVAASDVVAALTRTLHQLARQVSATILVVRDFEPEGLQLEKHFRAAGYHWVDSLPNTYLPVRWSSTGEYHAAMRSYFRSKVQKHLKRNVDASVRYERVADFAHLADALRAQWLVVHENASEYQREVLTVDFYRRMATDLVGRAEVLLFYRGDQLEAHALLLRDHDMLRWLYVGRNTAVNDSLYIYVAHAVVETAIAMGVSNLEMGLTTYPIKQDLGAEIVPIKLAVRARSALINPFVGLGYALLNKVPRPSPRAVFKQPPAKQGQQVPQHTAQGVPGTRSSI